MNEDILRSVFRRDEAKASGRVEELYGSCGHVVPLVSACFVASICIRRGGGLATIIGADPGSDKGRRGGYAGEPYAGLGHAASLTPACDKPMISKYPYCGGVFKPHWLPGAAMYRKLMGACVGLAMMGMAGTAQAIPITTDLVRSYPSINGGFGGGTVDPVTGKYYFIPNFRGEQLVQEFNSVAEFEAGTPSRTFSLLGTEPSGTYFSVQNGILYGRSTDFGTTITSWDVQTGLITGVSAPVPGMGGLNGTNTFDWGGFSGVNVISDGTQM